MKFARPIFRCAFILAACYIGGLALLFLAYMIPTGPIRQNLVESAQVFETEGVYPSLSKRTASTLDNFTDTKMLLTAGYEGTEPLVERVVMGYSSRLRSVSPVETFIHVYDPQSFPTEEELAISNYSRYWQGYLVVLKPLLVILNYSQIRLINALAQVALFVMLVLRMHRKNLEGLIAPLLISVITIAPVAITKSLQYSAVFYLTLTSCHVVVSKGRSWTDKGADSKLQEWFFFVGVLTSYFDFLTYPLLTLGFPIIILENMIAGRSLRSSVCELLGLCVFWGAGYALMWGGKWLIGALLLRDPNIVADALNQVSYRSSISEGAGVSLPQGYSVAVAVERNIQTYFSWMTSWLLRAAAVVCAFAAVFGVWRRRSNLRELCCDLRVLAYNHLPLLFIAALPFFWYVAIGNHSFVHSFFTYRVLSITTFAVVAFVFALVAGTFMSPCSEKNTSKRSEMDARSN